MPTRWRTRGDEDEHRERDMGRIIYRYSQNGIINGIINGTTRNLTNFAFYALKSPEVIFRKCGDLRLAKLRVPTIFWPKTLQGPKDGCLLLCRVLCT